MKKSYCLTCGSGTQYSVEKPNFCGKCGKSFGTSTCPTGPQGAVGPKGVRKKSTLATEEIENPYEGEDVMHVPHIDELEVEIEVSQARKGIKLEDLMGTSQGEAGMDFQEETRPEKEVLKELENESKALRP